MDKTDRKLFAREFEIIKPAIDQAFEGINITDLSGKIIYSNPAAEAIYGYERGELAGKHVTILSADPQFSTSQIIPAIKSLGHWEGDILQKKKDGSQFTVRLSATLLKKENRPFGMLGIIRDKTELLEKEVLKQNYERELIKRNRFIETILDNLPIGLAVNYIDEGKASYMNKKFEEIYGWSKDQLENVATFFEKVYPEPAYREKIQKQVMEDILSGDPARMTWEGYEVTGENGRKKIISAKNIPLYEQNLIISTVQDITEREKAEESLRKSQSLLKAITSTASDSIFCKDIERRYTFVNPAMTALLQCTEDELLGKTPEEVFGAEAAATIKEVDDMTFSGRRISEVRPLDIGGEKRFFHTVQVPMQVENGKVLSINGIVRDVTENIRTHEELMEYRNNLENKVEERTQELQFLIKAMSGRELRMVELKKVIERLRKQLKDAGLTPVADDPLQSPDF